MKKSVLIFVFLLIILSIVSILLLNHQRLSDKDAETLQKRQYNTDEEKALTEQPLLEQEEQIIISEKFVEWHYQEGAWKPASNPPICGESLLLKLPADINLVTSILYPGQKRGEEFKAHGGLRFDKSDNSIEIKAPMDAYLVSASSYLHEGERQYMLDFIHPCGIKYRIDHLVSIPSKIQVLLEHLPEPKEGDSRTYSVEPTFFAQEELLATSIGLNNNVFFDLGVYNLRSENDAGLQGEQSAYGVCWFDWLDAENSKKIRALPGADGKEGKNSVYC